MKKFLLVVVCTVLVQTFFYGNTVDTIYINAGLFNCVDGNQMPYKAFNSTPTFSQKNVQLHALPGDTLVLTVINNDTVQHGFEITQTSGLTDTVSAADTIQVKFVGNAEATHIFYDHLNYPQNSYLGLSGILSVGSATKKFYWNVKDHQLEWNDSIANSGAVSWTNYYPDYFTINGVSNPDVNLDSTARVAGFVGDTILIYVANSGQAAHSLHFHGYHCTIKYSSAHTNWVGRSKDTFPLESMDTYLLELVPDQPGEFPMHDHNLLSITAGGNYPFGMFLTILIQ